MMILYIVLAVLILAFAFCMILAWAVEKVGFGKRQEGNPLLRYFTAADFENLHAAPVEFSGNRGQTLRGNLYSDSTRTEYKALLIFVHGMGGGHLSYTTEIDYFAKRGFLVLSYDQTGTMASDGASLVGMPQGIYDLKSALDFVKQNSLTKNLPVLLAGHSWGAYIVSRILYFHPDVKGVVALSAPEDVPELLCAQAKVQTQHSIAFLKPFLRLYERLKFGAVAAKRTSEIVADSDTPILLLHGAADTAVPLSSAAANSELLKTRSNVQTQIYPEKQHNVYSSLQAEQYITEAFQKLGVLADNKENTEELQAYAASLDFRKMCEEDSAVMETVAAFLESCL